MNNNSLLCKFINEHPDTWRQELEEKKINIKEDGPFAIFSYDVFADFHDPIVQEARGIIIDIFKLNVLCWPFRKFGNYNESYADEIDWSTARVQEKVDGSIIKLWNNSRLRDRCWTFSTNNNIYANDSLYCQETGGSFLDLIKSAENYSKIDFNSLDTDYTYIFELVGPHNRVVVNYEKPYLYHIGTRNNKTGVEVNIDIGIEKPKEYPLTTFDQCIAASFELNKDKYFVEHEGFVVVDNNWHRIKIKSPDYLAVHRMIDNNSDTKKHFIDLIITDNDGEIEKTLEDFPKYKTYYLFYKYKLAELVYEVGEFMEYTKHLYEEYSFERKAVAMQIKDEKYKRFGFMALDNNELKAKDVIYNMTSKQLDQFIPDYIKS